MQDLTYRNRKDKYEFNFNCFSGSFAVEIRSSEKDKTKYARIPLNDAAIFTFKTLIDRARKLPAEKSEVMYIQKYDFNRKEYDRNTLIEIEKASNLVYSIIINTKINGENKTFRAPISFSNDFGYTSKEMDEREKSEFGIAYLKDYMDKVYIELALGTRDKKSYYMSETINNVANKVGAEISKPKFSKGGSGGGSKPNYPPKNNYQPPKEESFDSGDSFTPPDDDIPF